MTIPFTNADQLTESKMSECHLEIHLRSGDVMLLCCCYRCPTPTPTSNENNEKLIQPDI